ncbi:MAG: DUF2500 domain-containing protein [Bacillota bacterium]|nr:DUF2500 domain-containing protein [Bacillota bacterium]
MEIFIVLLICLAGIIIIFQGASTYFKNENAPIMTTNAKLIEKISIDTHNNLDGGDSTVKTLILKFQLETGSMIKLTVSSRVFRSITEHEWGILTFQGSRFHKFESESSVVEN